MSSMFGCSDEWELARCYINPKNPKQYVWIATEHYRHTTYVISILDDKKNYFIRKKIKETWKAGASIETDSSDKATERAREWGRQANKSYVFKRSLQKIRFKMYKEQLRQ